MQKVIWLSHNWNKKVLIDAYNEFKCNSVAFGSHGCFNKIPPNAFIIDIVKELRIEKITYITPYLSDKEIFNSIQTIKELSKSIFPVTIELVINDWGLLSALQEEELIGVQFELGINITSTLLYSAENIRYPLPSYVSNFLTTNNIFSLGIDDTYKNFDFSKFPKNYPYKLTFYTGYKRVVLGRQCYVAHNGVCKRECFQKEKKQLYSSLKSYFYDVGNEVYEDKYEFDGYSCFDPFTKVIINIL